LGLTKLEPGQKPVQAMLQGLAWPGLAWGFRPSWAHHYQQYSQLTCSLQSMQSVRWLIAGGGVPVHIKFLALAFKLLDSVYYPSYCSMLQLQCFLTVMRMAEKLFFIPKREFVMFPAKPVISHYQMQMSSITFLGHRKYFCHSHYFQEAL
jgi:hypothetical protein